MKQSYWILLFLAALFSINIAAAQSNASINILTQNSGQVAMGGTVFLQVDVGNTGPTSSIGVYKIKTQISVPTGIASVAATGHQLPAGWTITSQSAGVINLSNGTDIIPVNAVRTILINIQGNTIGGPSTIGSQLTFSNGNAPGTAPGSLAGDITADNSSQSSLQVVDPVPVTLSDFKASLVNCQPTLNWITQSEVNSDRFEIERSDPSPLNWNTIGTVGAHGFTSSASKYNLVDNNTTSISKKLLYRLKMIDKDGKFKYSNVLAVSLNCKEVVVSVFPNPVQDGKLYVSITGIKANVEATLLSLSGQLVLKTTVSNGTQSLDVSKVANGIYMLNVIDINGTNKVVKVNIQN